MASNKPEPSSSSESPPTPTPTTEAPDDLNTEAQPFCDVSKHARYLHAAYPTKEKFDHFVAYVHEADDSEYQNENFVGHFKSDERLSPSVSYSQFGVDPSDSVSNYPHVTIASYSTTVDHVSTSCQNHIDDPSDSETSQEQFDENMADENKRQVVETLAGLQISLVHSRSPDVLSTEPSSSQVLALSRESGVHNGHVQDADSDATFERVSMAVDHLNLQHISVVHHGVPSLGGLPIFLDRNGITALMSTSRSDSSLCLDSSGLPRSVISSQTVPQRTLLTPEQSQFLIADTSMSGVSHSLLSPVLSQRDVLPSIITSPSSSSSQMLSSTVPISHKHMLAQKYAAELEAPSTSASLISDIRDHQLIDSHTISMYEHVSSLPSTSASQCLPIDVYAIDRSVALVSSTRDSSDDVINGDVEFVNVSTPSSHHTSVHDYVSSSVDLVHTHRIDQDMHCAVDSTVGPKLPQDGENVVDSSDSYGHHVNTSVNGVLHTTTRGDYDCHISDINSCDEATASNAVASVLNNTSVLSANEALSSSTNPRFSAHSQFSDSVSHNSVDDAQSCATVSSATHPDSTRSPDLSESTHNIVVSSGIQLSSSELEISQEYSRPRRDLKSNRHWCEDCGLFYEKDCPHHRIQLIFDKPVLSRAWASLPATYLYVNKIGIDESGEPVYGVFAKKTIPKRTQFGPIEGVLVKREDPPSENFILLIEHEDSIALYLDTSDESMSNWMRFVRPAETHKEQNLVLVQHETSLFFNTTRSINPKTELRVWYSSAYAEKWGLPILEPDEEERRALQEQENAWPCFECNQRFATSEDLQKHLNQHDEENGNLSDQITIRSKARARAKGKIGKKSHPSLLRNALEGVEQVSDGDVRKNRGRPPKKYKLTCKQEDYKCDICFKIFPRNYSLQRHLIMHSGEKKYKCPICDMKFSHVYNRNRHVRRHKQRDENLSNSKPSKSLFRKKQGALWICTHCDLTFDNSSVLNLHTLTHAAEDVGRLMDGRYMSDEGIENTSNESSKLSEELHKCPECTQEFLSRKDLIEHASVHGKVGKQRYFRGVINPLKPYKCNLCYKSFASDERLIRHYLVHGSEDSKPLQCDICFKRFLNNSALACHIKVHSEERKCYECPICKMEFDQIVSLKEHVHIHCDNGVYSCPNCHKIFEEYNQIRKHIRAFHSERRYPCDKCEKIFPRPDKLKLHMLRHSDHREFLCANCGKQFKRKDKLKEHMKRMHAPEREAKINAKNAKSSGSKKFVPKVSPTDYHRFIYKCHTCLLGFKRRGMLVNHLAKRHPDIRPESVPELNLPILKTTRDYYCQYCEKVYKSSSKRKAHILKNHPGSELPMSNRRKGGVPEIPGMPNPTFSQTVGSITTHPHHCNWCHKQYASKAKLLQHQRKKHVDMLTLSYVASNTKVETVCDQETQVTGQILIGSVTGGINSDSTTVLIDATKRKMHYVDRDVLVSHPEGLPTADLLTQAMSELTQNFAEYRSSPGEFLTSRLSGSTSPPSVANHSPSTTPTPTPTPVSISTPASPTINETTISSPSLDQMQLNQLLAQYQQQPLSPQQMAAVVVTSVSRTWPTAVTATLSNYPAR